MPPSDRGHSNGHRDHSEGETGDVLRNRLVPMLVPAGAPDEALAEFSGGPSQGYGQANLTVHRLVRRFWIEPWGRRYRTTITRPV